MRPGKAAGNYPLDRLFVHECGRMAAPANPAGTVKQGNSRDAITILGLSVRCIEVCEASRVASVDFEGPTKMFILLFQIRRQHTFDPFHEGADSAR
jgi:hypothetical protein